MISAMKDCERSPDRRGKRFLVGEVCGEKMWVRVG